MRCKRRRGAAAGRRQAPARATRPGTNSKSAKNKNERKKRRPNKAHSDHPTHVEGRFHQNKTHFLRPQHVGEGPRHDARDVHCSELRRTSE